MPLLLALALAALTPAPPASPYNAAWAASLRPGQTVTLPRGNYRGPWKLGTGVHLIALPGAVLEGGNPVLTIAGDAVIVEGLTVRAAEEGVGVATVDAHGALLRNLRVSGGTRGISLKRGSVTVRGGRVESSSKFGIWIQGCSANISSLEVRRIKGTAVYAGHGSATLTELTISESEYGLLAYKTRIELSRSHFSKISRAGVGITITAGSIVETELEGPFSEAALSITAARPIVLRGNRIRHAGSMGIKLLNSAATLSQNEISETSSDKNGLEGDGLYASNCEIDSTSDRMLDNAGAAVAIMGGKASLTGCEIERAGQAAVSVSEAGEAVISHCRITGGSTELIVAAGATLTNDTADR